MSKRWRNAFAVAALGAAFLGLASARSDAAGRSTASTGGIFQIVFAPPEQLDSMDPAIANTQASWSLLDLTCARLMTYPDKPAPQSFHLIPEVAAAPPTVSRGRQEVHVHAETRLQVQRRKARRCPGVCTRDQSHLGAGPEVARHALHAGHRRRPRGAGGESDDRKRRCRPRLSPRHPARATAGRLPRAHEHAVLLRRPPEPPRRSRGTRRLRGLRPLLRLRVPARPEGDDLAQSLLPRPACAQASTGSAST